MSWVLKSVWWFRQSVKELWGFENCSDSYEGEKLHEHKFGFCGFCARWMSDSGGKIPLIICLIEVVFFVKKKEKPPKVIVTENAVNISAELKVSNLFAWKNRRIDFVLYFYEENQFLNFWRALICISVLYVCVCVFMWACVCSDYILLF